ncbi:MAG: hypothetical protein JST06_00135 [Bacteroidetes bacterium]|nr:hypothetical protein [Bacteroidota bacterium]MBS1629478.1 hypothetical protein [Bacteroidota bacterium]
MKKLILVITVAIMSGGVYAQQHQGKKTSQQKPVRETIAKSDPAQQKAEARTAASKGFDPNTRYWLENLRSKVYGFQKKRTGRC